MKKSKRARRSPQVVAVTAKCAKCNAAASVLEVYPLGSRGPSRARQNAVNETGAHLCVHGDSDGSYFPILKATYVIMPGRHLTRAEVTEVEEGFRRKTWFAVLKLLDPKVPDARWLPNYCPICDEMYCNGHWDREIHEAGDDLLFFGKCPKGHRRSLDSSEPVRSAGSGQSAEEKVGLQDLVDAYFTVSSYEGEPSELFNYYKTKLAILEDLFGFSIRAVEKPEALNRDAVSERRPFMSPRRDRENVRWIARNCLEDKHPFPVWYEGGPGPLEASLTKAHGGTLERLKEEVERIQAEVFQELRRTFADAVTKLAPGIEGKQFDAEDLYRKGLPRTIPSHGSVRVVKGALNAGTAKDEDQATTNRGQAPSRSSKAVRKTQRPRKKGKVHR